MEVVAFGKYEAKKKPSKLGFLKIYLIKILLQTQSPKFLDL
jgi:hypothetical protein